MSAESPRVNGPLQVIKCLAQNHHISCQTFYVSAKTQQDAKERPLKGETKKQFCPRTGGKSYKLAPGLQNKVSDLKTD